MESSNPPRFHRTVVLHKSRDRARDAMEALGWPSAAWKYVGSAAGMHGIRFYTRRHLIVFKEFWDRADYYDMWTNAMVSASMDVTSGPGLSASFGREGMPLLFPH